MVARNDQAELRCLKLLNKVGELVMEGKRDPEVVADVLQAIKDGKKSEANDNQLAEWQTFLHEELGIKLDLSGISIPEKREGFNWPIIVPEGMTAEKIVAKMRKQMKVWVWDEKDLKKITSVREPDKTYAVWVRDRVEADEELANKSADDLKREGVNCVTLPERLMLEFFYYWKNEQHLDYHNWTLCAGSRSSDGCVPRVFWDPDCGEVDVSWRYSGGRSSCLRSRVAVS